MDRFPLMSLFSGSGGLDLGFENGGFRVPLAVDNNAAAIETYNNNRELATAPGRIADLSTVDPQILISWWFANAGRNTKPRGIIGGPPCQAFSVANVHKIPNDPRAKLPLDYVRILKAFDNEFDLDFFLFENVYGLAHRRHNDAMKELLSLFEGIGFDVRLLALDAVEYNVPQYRKRLFIVGVKSSRFSMANYSIPAGSPVRKTVRQTIEGLPEPRFFSRNDKPTRAPIHPNHWCMNPRSEKFRNGYLLSGTKTARSFRVLDWDRPSRTVSYGHREVHVHPNATRRLSVYEAMLLQGFPNDYRLFGTLSDQFRMVSDAVPPPMAYALAESIKEFLTHHIRRDEGKEQSSTIGQNLQLGLAGLQTANPRSTNA